MNFKHALIVNLEEIKPYLHSSIYFDVSVITYIAQTTTTLQGFYGKTVSGILNLHL